MEALALLVVVTKVGYHASHIRSIVDLADGLTSNDPSVRKGVGPTFAW